MTLRMSPTPKSWLAISLFRGLRLAGRLSLPRLHAIGTGVGRVLWWAHGRPRRLAERNLSLVLTQKSAETRHALARATLIEAGKSLAESARIWTRPPADVLGLVREVRGRELFAAALADSRGLLVAAPHLGCWELLNVWLAERCLAACNCAETPATADPGLRDCARCRLAILYRPPRRTGLEPLLRGLRAAVAVDQVRAEGPGVRTLYRRLRDGGTVGILPDQQPRAGDGVMAPFFGVPARTMVLVSRLAERTGATVLFAFAERLPRGTGFRIHILPAPDAIADPDIQRACTALNRGVEDCVRLAFTQYQWHYKRFPSR
jgi:KDO2-lipid IV(A) lauroyltransferase